MKARWTLVVAAALGAGGLAAAPAEAGAGDYEYTVIYESTDELSELGCPALNNAGQVAFTAEESWESGGDLSVVFRGDGGTLTTIASSDEPQGSPSINDSGEVAFREGSSDSPETAIYVGDGTSLRKIVTNRPVTYNSRSLSLNDRGFVAFDADSREDGGHGLYLARQPGSARPLFTTREDGYYGDHLSSHVSLSADAIAFVSGWEWPQATGVFRQSWNGDLTTIAEHGDTVLRVIGATLNDHGEVAFWARLDGVRAIMAGSGGPIRTIAEATRWEGPFKSFRTNSPSINNAGTVAFTGWPQGERAGVYVGPNPESDRVAGPGDTIDDAAVETATSCHEALNDVGQVAFTATMVDGQELIVRADPV